MRNFQKSIIASLLIISSCQNIDKNKNSKVENTVKEETIYKPFIPENIASNELDQYSIEHYWDNYQFADSNQTILNNYGEQAFVDFINKFPNQNKDILKNSVHNFCIFLKNKAQKSTTQYFIKLIDSYLYNSNSPFYNENYYEIFLTTLLENNVVDANQRIRYQTILKLLKKNQVGSLATDFKFHSKSANKSLYSINARNLIILFYEPTCPICQETIKFLKNSARLNQMIENQELKILTLYPDGNQEIWNNYINQLPNNWINGIDTDQVILQNALYDLKASPTIYLLDSEKRVMAKDCPIEFLIDKFELNK